MGIRPSKEKIIATYECKILSAIQYFMNSEYFSSSIRYEEICSSKMYDNIKLSKEDIIGFIMKYAFNLSDHNYHNYGLKEYYLSVINNKCDDIIKFKEFVLNLYREFGESRDKSKISEIENRLRSYLANTKYKDFNAQEIIFQFYFIIDNNITKDKKDLKKNMN